MGEKLRQHREQLGLTWAEAAKVIGIDPSTVSRWENLPDARQNRNSRSKIEWFLRIHSVGSVQTRTLG
jgi:transcriptional regulator with XRE-family HTH domain